MLLLRSCVLPKLLYSRSTPPISSLRRLLSAAAPPIPPNPSFAVEDYLVDSCGLTRAQALRVSPKLSHLKSPSMPDAVLAFLAGIGLSGADVAALVAKDPKFICARVESTLAPNLAGITDLGISRPEVARLVSLAPGDFRRRSIVPKLHYYLPLFGSAENLFRVLKCAHRLLRRDIDRIVNPNVAFLRECGLGACDIAKLCINSPRLPSTNLGRLRAMVACAEGLGVPRGSLMFRHVLVAVAFQSEEKIATKVDYLKKTFRWSDAEVRNVVSKSPSVLRKARESLQRRSEFLFSEVGLEPAYIARLPAMLSYSVEGRMRPRYYFVKFLKENGLLKCDPSYYSIFNLTEKEFEKRYICPHKEAMPHLAGDYVDACRGVVSTNFRFIWTKDGL